MVNAALVPVVNAEPWRRAKHVFVQGFHLGYIDSACKGKPQVRCWLVKSTNVSTVLVLPNRTLAILELIRWHQQHPEGKLYAATPLAPEPKRLVIRARVCRDSVPDRV